MNTMPCCGRISSFCAEASPKSLKSSWTNCIARRVYASELCVRKPASWAQRWPRRYPHRVAEKSDLGGLDGADTWRLRDHLAPDFAPDLAAAGYRAPDGIRSRAETLSDSIDDRQRHRHDRSALPVRRCGAGRIRLQRLGGL